MNNARRKEIAKAIDLLTKADALLDEAKEILEFERDAEREAFDNLPENAQASERAQAINEHAEALEEVVDELDDFNVSDILDKLNEAIAL